MSVDPSIPFHLRKYVVDQDYDRYSAIDQAAWRFILRQLKNFLKTRAHASYASGLEKTGISTERIPKISEMSEKLKVFGWRAVPVSGFIPPAAFMEMQSLGILPIASDMRSIEHLTYTPAPDIVHEAAGHAPLLVDPEFTAYLQKYAQVARKAILNSSDLEMYEAIRELSDLKENPHATEAALEKSYARLEKAKITAGEPSELALLARMNWWTAEYGLIGSVTSPKIYGAGLLSSVGESATCLQEEVRKIPFSLECLNYNYDITEPQPQIFVTPNFETLGRELDRLADSLAFRRGGREGLDKAIASQTVNTVQLDSGLQISGKLEKYQVSFVPTKCEVAYYKFSGPTQICVREKQLIAEGLTHDTKRHAHGFSSPLGMWKGVEKSPTQLSDQELASLKILRGQKSVIETESGVVVHGIVQSWVRADGKLALITFTDCVVTLGTEILFRPEWGDYDCAVGTAITSVFGGPADREAYGETDDFVAARVAPRTLSAAMITLTKLYAEVRALREGARANDVTVPHLDAVKRIAGDLDAQFPNEWLLRLELIELLKATASNPSTSASNPSTSASNSAAPTQNPAATALIRDLESFLSRFSKSHPETAGSIQDGLKIADQIRV